MTEKLHWLVKDGQMRPVCKSCAKKLVKQDDVTAIYLEGAKANRKSKKSAQ